MSDPLDREPDTDFLWDVIPKFLRRNRKTRNTRVLQNRLEKGASHYRMDYERRGVAALFNQVGGGVVCSDMQSLTNTFSMLGFEIEKFNDMPLCQVESTLEELSSRDHSDCDCFTLVYLSRGFDGKLRARDKTFDVNKLWGNFTAEKSPTLANKPKMFIMQGYSSCKGRRGRLCDEHEEEIAEDDENSDKLKTYYIPDRSDFLIVLSTMPGVTSPGPGRKMGSLFVQTLCRHIDTLGFSQDMMTILTDVNRQLIDDGNADAMRKQPPTIISLLIRVFKFSPKNDDEISPMKQEAIAWVEEDEEEWERNEGIEEDTEFEETRRKRRKIFKSVRYPEQCSARRFPSL